MSLPSASLPFTVRIPGALASVLPTTGVVITPAIAALIAVLAGLGVFGLLCAYAISKGYLVKRKSPDGEEWEFSPP